MRLKQCQPKNLSIYLKAFVWLCSDLWRFDLTTCVLFVRASEQKLVLFHTELARLKENALLCNALYYHYHWYISIIIILLSIMCITYLKLQKLVWKIKVYSFLQTTNYCSWYTYYMSLNSWPRLHSRNILEPNIKLDGMRPLQFLYLRHWLNSFGNIITFLLCLYSNTMNLNTTVRG